MKLPVIVFLLSAFIVTSCSDEYPFDIDDCACHTLNNGIDGWGDSQDSTLVNTKDSIGGFDITVKGWNNSETHDINL